MEDVSFHLIIPNPALQVYDKENISDHKGMVLKAGSFETKLVSLFSGLCQSEIDETLLKYRCILSLYSVS